MHRAVRHLPLFAFATLLAFVLIPTRADAAESSAPAKRLTFFAPFTTLTGSGCPVVEVQFDNGAMGKFLIDTDSENSTITQAMVDRLPRPYHIDAYLTGMGTAHGGIIGAVSTPHMMVAGLRIENPKFILYSLGNGTPLTETRCDGVLGAAFLEQFCLYLDYRNHRMAFAPGKLTDADLADFGMADAHRAKLTRFRSGSAIFGETTNLPDYRAKITVHHGDLSVEEDCLVSTSCYETILSRDAAQSLKLEASRHEASPWSAYEVLGVSAVDGLQIGDLAIPARSLRFSEHEPLKMKGVTEIGRTPAALGEDILSRCTVLLDFPGRMMYLTPTLAPLESSSGTEVDGDRLKGAIALPDLRVARRANRWGDPVEEYVGQVADEARMANAADASVAGPLYRKLGAKYRLMGDGLRAATAYFTAVQDTEAFAKRNPTESVAQIEWAMALSEAGVGRDAEAEAIARKVMADEPKSVAAQVCLGWVLENRAVSLLKGPDISDTALAVPATLPLLDLLPLREMAEERAAHRPDKATIAKANTFRDAAGTCFDRAVTLGPSDADAFAARAEYRVHSGLCIDAVALLWRGKEPQWNELIDTPEYLSDRRRMGELRPDDVDTLAYNAMLEALWPITHSDAKTREKRAESGSLFSRLTPAERVAPQNYLDRLEAISRSANPNAPAAAESLGVLELNLRDDSTAAETAFRRALGRPGAEAQLVALLQRQSRWADFATLLRDPNAAGAQTVAQRLLLVRALDLLGQPGEAVEAAAATEKQYPEVATTHLMHAALLLRETVGVSSDAAKDRLAVADAALHAAEEELTATGEKLGLEQHVAGEHPREPLRYALQAERSEEANLRAVYLTLTGAVDRARTLLLEATDADPTDTAALEMLAAMQ